MASPDKPDGNKYVIIFLRGGGGANLIPNHEVKGMMPWWTTWRVDRWLNFFRNKKKKESMKSMNFEKKYHQVMSAASNPSWV